VETLELLDQLLILSQMDRQISKKLNELKIETSLDSTNSALQRLPLAQQHCTAILAEQQKQGRGRRGKYWHSPYGRNLYLSLGWQFEQSLADLRCLPLVVALSVAQALSRAGLEGHRVKWPNDLLLGEKKLCGCLVEVQGDAGGPSYCVVGVGINVHMPATEVVSEIDQPWTDLGSHLPGCSRNSLAAILLEELIVKLSLFADQAFEPFKEQWEKTDGLSGQHVEAVMGQQTLHGIVKGIDDRGALLLDTGKELLRLHSAEVSLKPRWRQ